MGSLTRLTAAFAFLLLSPELALSQAPAGNPAPGNLNNSQIRERWKAELNENLITIVSGNPNGGYLRIAYDIAAVVDEGNNLRVMPVIGNGAVQNTRDILFLRGIDMGLVNAVALDYFEKTGELGTNLKSQIAYITMLFQDELHLLVRPEISSFRDLEGKRVNFSDKGSGAQLAARGIFDALKMNVQEFNSGQADAIEMMKRGELDATLCTCLKPLAPYQRVAKEAGLKLIGMPYERAFHDLYVPAKIHHSDYPNLIPEGETIETIAVQTMLAAYNWPENHPRYARLEKFVNAFFTKFPKFMQPPRHPRWKSVNLAAEAPGWNRFAPAQRWLDEHKSNAGPDISDAKMRAAFETFLAQYTNTTSGALLPEERVEALYGEFNKWWKNKVGASAQ